MQGCAGTQIHRGGSGVKAESVASDQPASLLHSDPCQHSGWTRLEKTRLGARVSSVVKLRMNVGGVQAWWHTMPTPAPVQAQLHVSRATCNIPQFRQWAHQHRENATRRTCNRDSCVASFWRSSCTCPVTLARFEVTVFTWRESIFASMRSSSSDCTCARVPISVD